MATCFMHLGHRAHISTIRHGSYLSVVTIIPTLWTHAPRPFPGSWCRHVDTATEMASWLQDTLAGWIRAMVQAGFGACSNRLKSLRCAGFPLSHNVASHIKFQRCKGLSHALRHSHCQRNVSSCIADASSFFATTSSCSAASQAFSATARPPSATARPWAPKQQRCFWKAMHSPVLLSPDTHCLVCLLYTSPSPRD